MFRANQNKKIIKALVVVLEFLAIGILIYLIVLPFYPTVKYKLSQQGKSARVDWQNFETVKQKTEEMISNSLPISENTQRQEERVGQSANLPKAEYDDSSNRVIITKIGVNAPIIDSDNENYGLSRGVWRIPTSSTPDKIGNTVITGHRFKYLPPSNLTFYLFDKLKIGDIVSIIWQKKDYYYKIKEIKTVNPQDLSILKKTEKPILTLFTCDPIYSQKNRLVIIGELIKN
ncbi:MAG: sortase [Patescibacteria group bacterium]|nr:sortase [Patescibacteria group bacterium]